MVVDLQFVLLHLDKITWWHLLTWFH